MEVTADDLDTTQQSTNMAVRPPGCAIYRCVTDLSPSPYLSLLVGQTMHTIRQARIMIKCLQVGITRILIVKQALDLHPRYSHGNKLWTCTHDTAKETSFGLAPTIQPRKQALDLHPRYSQTNKLWTCTHDTAKETSFGLAPTIQPNKQALDLHPRYSQTNKLWTCTHDTANVS